jgi:hypothetical protein
VSDDQPEQIELEASILMPPPLDASVSDQRVIGPPFVRKATFTLVSTLRLDFSTRPWLAPDTVMFAPVVKSLEAPVDVSETAPDEFIAPVGETAAPEIVTPPPLAISGAEPT